MDPEPPGGHLDDGVGPVGIKIRVKPALAGVVVGPQLPGRPRQAFMRVIADGAVTHGRKKNRHGKLQTGRFLWNEMTRGVSFYFARAPPEGNAGLHRLAERIDGGIGYL